MLVHGQVGASKLGRVNFNACESLQQQTKQLVPDNSGAPVAQCEFVQLTQKSS